MDRRRELRKGLKKTGRYLLSHHKVENFNRCYSFQVWEKTVHLCSRCLGIYTGIIAGGVFLSAGKNIQLIFIALFPLPTAVEKFFTGVKNFSGYNTLRTVLGFFLGLAYIQALGMMLEDPFRPLLIAAGFFYVLLALVLLRLKER